MNVVKYQTKPRQAEVVKFDGSMGGAHGILAWLYGRKAEFSGKVEKGDYTGKPNEVIIDSVGALSGDFVVLSLDDSKVYIYKPDKFIHVFDKVRVDEQEI